MKVFIDHREMRSRVVDELIELGAEIEITTLGIGDYLRGFKGWRRPFPTGEG